MAEVSDVKQLTEREIRIGFHTKEYDYQLFVKINEDTTFEDLYKLVELKTDAKEFKLEDTYNHTAFDSSQVKVWSTNEMGFCCNYKELTDKILALPYFENYGSWDPSDDNPFDDQDV